METPLTNDDIRRAEQWAADADAARAYQRMCDEATHYAAQAAADVDADAAYARDDAAAETDLF
jgi:hypothetical protein